jgi:acyl-CoA thioesterase FadM
MTRDFYVFRTANLASVRMTDDDGNRYTITAQGFPAEETEAAFLETVRAAPLATVRTTSRTPDGTTVETRTRITGPDAAVALAELLACA